MHKYQQVRELHMEVQLALKTLNEYWYVVMQTGDSSIPLPDEVLGPFYKLMKQMKIRDADFVTPIHMVTATLAQEPILVDTGRYRPKYPQRTYADMEGEIASTLTNLPNYQACIKTVKGEATIVSLPLKIGVTGTEYEERWELVQAHTRQAYCRPVAEVKQEIADRQAALMEEEERVQGRREAVEQGQSDGQTQQWRPSRRHKQPPN